METERLSLSSRIYCVGSYLTNESDPWLRAKKRSFILIGQTEFYHIIRQKNKVRFMINLEITNKFGLPLFCRLFVNGLFVWFNNYIYIFIYHVQRVFRLGFCDSRKFVSRTCDLKRSRYCNSSVLHLFSFISALVHCLGLYTFIIKKQTKNISFIIISLCVLVRDKVCGRV